MTAQDPITEVEDIVARARAAQQQFEAGGSQALYDRAATAAAWAIMEPSHNETLAKLAVETTGLGFEKAGFDVIACIEHNETFCKTLRRNFPEKKIFGPPDHSGDVSKVDEVISDLEQLKRLA